MTEIQNHQAPLIVKKQPQTNNQTTKEWSIQPKKFHFYQLFPDDVFLMQHCSLKIYKQNYILNLPFLLLMTYCSAEYINLLNKKMQSSLPLIQKSKITFQSSTRKATLIKPVESRVEASYSTVLTLASFLLYHYPLLVPPKFLEPNLEGNAVDNEFPQTFLTYNRLYEPWCDYLSELFLHNKVSQTDDVCHMYAQVTQEFIVKLKSDIFEITQKQETTILPAAANSQTSSEIKAQEEQINFKNTAIKSKKIAVINFALSQLRTDFIRPKMHLIGLFTGIFYNEGDQWSTYNVLKRHYPTVQEYKQIDTIILSGSNLSVNDEKSEIVDFVETLKEAVKVNPKLKILGICFGHQILAKMFGGKIVQKKQIAGVERIHFDQELIQNTPYFKRTQIGGNTFQLSEYHKDFVVQVPQNFSIFGQSQSCKIQSLISKDLKYLSFQFHPEYSAEYIRSFQMRLQHYQIFDLKSAYSHTERSTIQHDSSLWEIRKIIRSFLDWDSGENIGV